jgi:hypothetical protein
MMPDGPLQLKDFVPRQIAAPGFLKPGEYESFDDALAAANRWLEDSGVELVSVETVVLPNIWSRWEEGPADVALATSGESPSRWHQFIRCWYRGPAV